jgi:chemotaxis protein methyltransferase CheR
MFDKIDFEGELKESFISLIAKYTGLKIRDSELSVLVQNLNLRMKALRINSLRQYYTFLNSNNSESNKEWITFISNLTNTESYFFRDKGQFNLLRNELIPDLIKRNNQSRNIRIWSAGCSSGEEVYSLAILLTEIIPDLDLWNVTILGTDINEKALTKAKKGIYTNWSFRTVSEEIKSKNFKFSNNQYQVKPHIKKLVNFANLNLVKDNFPSENSLIKEMDLIICRNVFIYFQPAAIREVLNKFYQTLKPDGFLLTGHAELAGQDLKMYKTHIFPQSLIYQKEGNNNIIFPLNNNLENTVITPTNIPTNPLPIPPILPINTPIPTLTNNISNPQQLPALFIPPVVQPIPFPPTPLSLQNTDKQDENLLQEAETCFKQKQYNLAIEKVKEYLKKHSQSFKAYYIIAKIYANIGQHEEAIKNCKQALKINEFAVEPYYLLAKISEDQGELNECKQLLKKIIYLDANFIPGYLDLSHIYQQEGDTKRALKMRETALQLLTKLNPKERIEHIEYATVSELMEQLKK